MSTILSVWADWVAIPMALVELCCPRCGGDVRMDKSMMFGTCEHCGARCMLQEMMPGNSGKSSGNGSGISEGDQSELALRHLILGDVDSAYAAIGRALRADPDDIRAWVLKGIVDGVDVSAALGESEFDPVRDLDFCARLADLCPDAARIVAARLDHPLGEAIATVVDAMALAGREHTVLTVYDDELDTGYDRIRGEVRRIADSLGEAVDLLRSDGRLPRLLARVSMDDTAGKLRTVSEWMDSQTPVDSQDVTVIYDGIGFLSTVEHVCNGRSERLRPKKGRMDVRVSVGRHVFRNPAFPDDGFVMLVPRMPRVGGCTGLLSTNGGIEVLHCYMLRPGLYLNVNTRDHALPAAFDMDGNRVNTRDNVHRLGRFL